MASSRVKPGKISVVAVTESRDERVLPSTPSSTKVRACSGVNSVQVIFKHFCMWRVESCSGIVARARYSLVIKSLTGSRAASAKRSNSSSSPSLDRTRSRNMQMCFSSRICDTKVSGEYCRSAQSMRSVLATAQMASMRSRLSAHPSSRKVSTWSSKLRSVSMTSAPGSSLLTPIRLHLSMSSLFFVATARATTLHFPQTSSCSSSMCGT
mmetsp:Transcript_21060/g.62274  ORF Transcript_21060/g.62274 Transcript_21060/m.62274 type:complete len:210 (-) Transcript_21060:103-732(-)